MIVDRTRPYKLSLAALAVTLAFSGCASFTTPGKDSTSREPVPGFSPARPVVVIPGFGNSKLWDPVANEYVWGTPRNMVRTAYEDDLDLPVDEASGLFGRDRLVPRGGFVGSRGPVNVAWRISNGLAKRGPYSQAKQDGDPAGPGEIYGFGYDFRLSAADNARQLDAFIEGIRARHGDATLEVDIVAHSAGGLVALTYLKLGVAGLDRPEEWGASSREAASKVGRLVLIAVPQEGTAEAIRVLARGEKLVRRAWPPAMMASFPSIAEMLPESSDPFVDETGAPLGADVWDPAWWQRAGFAIYAPGTMDVFARHGVARDRAERAFHESLERASRLRAALRRPFPDGVEIATFAGDCTPTAEKVLFRADGTLAFYPSELGPEEQALASILFGPGDGSIAARSATARADRAGLFCSGHQGIASSPLVHDAILRLLSGSDEAEGPEGVARPPQRMETSPSR